LCDEIHKKVKSSNKHLHIGMTGSWLTCGENPIKGRESVGFMAGTADNGKKQQSGKGIKCRPPEA
jgi:hypothetical protein